MKNIKVANSKGRIAILDDDEQWSFAVAIFLKRHGFSVETFTDTQAFLHIAQSFDVVLIDYVLPENHQQLLCGSDIIIFISVYLDAPPAMILISAYFVDDVRVVCPGAEAYLSKTIGFAAIAQQIEQSLSKRTEPKLAQ